MIAFLIIFLVLSLALNGVLVYYSYKAARLIMDVSEEISLFWASIVDYKDYLDSINDMHVYENTGTIRGFIEATKNMIKQINKFRDFCEISDILSEEELNLLEEMEEDYKSQREEVNKDTPEDEHIKEWNKDRKRKIEQQSRPTISPKTKGIQQG